MAANYKSLFNESSANYIAILEGDDYWIDKYKLQKQVEILESNPDVGMIHTNYYSLFEDGRIKKGHIGEKKTSLSGYIIGPTQTAEININPLTTCFRANLAKDNVDFDFLIKNNLLTIDIFLWAEVCRRARVMYLDEVTGVYRIHWNSITGNRDITSIERFSKTAFISVNYLMKKYDTTTDIKEAFYSRNKIDLIYQFLLAKLPYRAKDELRNVKIKRSLKDKIICLSAKYSTLNFVSHLLDFIYKYGSNLKQFIDRQL
jgi:hypothetical protein